MSRANLNTTVSRGGNVRTQHGFVVLDDIRAALVGVITKWDAFMGCVGWVTDLEVLDAMQGRSLGLAVQKEEMLRGDPGSDSYKLRLRRAYDATSYYEHGYGAGQAAQGRAARQRALRRGVWHPRQQRQRPRALPQSTRQHAPQVPGARRRRARPLRAQGRVARVVHLSNNAANSLEDATYEESPSLALVYDQRACDVYRISEPLDWTSEACAPEFA
jgi:hypothetical protein